MDKFRISMAVALVVLCMGAGLTVCSTTPGQVADDEPTPSQTKAEPLDEEVAKYALGGRVPLVFKIRGDAFDGELAQAIEPMLQTPFVPRMAAGMWAEIAKRGPAGLLAHVVTLGDWVEQLDGERATYITREVLAPESYWRALRYGAIIQPDGVNPQAIHTRYLLPCDDPGEVARQIKVGAVDGGRLVEVNAGERFVRVDVVERRAGIDAEAVSEFAVSRGGSVDDLRRTPTLDHFVASDAPISLYFRGEDFRLEAAAYGIFEAYQALEHATPENRVRMLARGGALSLNSLLFAPASEIENEDTVVELRADNAGSVVIDATSTLTERGVQVARSASSAGLLEGVPSVSSPDHIIGEFAWNLDASALAADAPVKMQLDGSRRRSPAARLAEGYRSGGWRAYALTLFVSPTLPIRALIPALGDDSAQAMPPKVGRFQVSHDASESLDGPTDLAIAGGMRFEETQDAAEMPAFLDPFVREMERLGLAPEVELAGASGGGQTVEIRTGQATSSQKREDLDLAPASLVGRVDIAAILKAQGRAGLADNFDTLSPMRVQWRLAEPMSRIRLQFGPGDIKEPSVAVADDFQALQSPGSECAHKLALVAVSTFEGLEAVSASEPAQRYLSLMSQYDDEAEECARQSPELADDLQLARARMRGMLGLRAMQDAAKAAIRKNACELGDEAQCE